MPQPLCSFAAARLHRSGGPAWPFHKGDACDKEIADFDRGRQIPPIAHPGRLLRRELDASGLSANRVAQGLGVPSGRITDILNGRRGISADTAVRLGRYFGNRVQFWLDLQSQYNIALVQRDRGEEIARRFTPPTWLE
jgi:antitoxin HigA-1